MLRSLSLFSDRECAAEKRLGSGVVAHILQQGRQIVQADAGRCVVRALEFLIKFKGELRKHNAKKRVST